MSARILIVDDVPANTRLLEAKLSAEYYQTATAEWQPDLILLDVMMPGMDGFECCRRLKAQATTRHIPVVMVTALGQPSERLQGLEAGADDFLTKPVESETLMARVRSLVRLKRLLDEWHARGETARALGLGTDPFEVPSVVGTRALVVDDWDVSASATMDALPKEGIIARRARSGREAMAMTHDEAFDLIVVSLTLAEEDSLRLVSAIRAGARSHETPLLLLAETEARDQVVRGFELGASDWLMLPVDENELRARARNQIRRKLYQDNLRSDLGSALEMALIDPLTGLYNQRYLRRHLAGLVANGQGRQLSVLMVDVDHFKKVNDEYGHATGDKALRLIADTLRASTRVFDSLARYGGEEFVVVMPGADVDDASLAAERLRAAVAAADFRSPGGSKVGLTVSVGVGCATGSPVTPEALLQAADTALYAAKAGGRNRVELAALT